MSAFPSQDHHLRRHWVTISELATMTGKSRRTLQWACLQGDLQNCHRYEPRPGGGAPVIKIDLAHAPDEYRLAWAEKRREETGAAILKLTDKQCTKAAAMGTLLEEISAHLVAQKSAPFTEAEIIDAFLSHRRMTDPGVPSLRTFYRWRERWLEGGKSLASLADQRAMPGKGVKVEVDEDLFAFYCSLYLTQNKLAAKDCYRQTKAWAFDKKIPVPSLQTLKREMYRRVPLSKQVELREGKEARRNQCDSSIDRDLTTLAGNEFWVSDHCQFDIIGYDDLPGHELAKDGSFRLARMWVTTWMDERSRFVVGYRIHRGPNSYEVMASAHDAILAEDIPQNMRLDNGKEYRCKRFAGGRAWRDEIERVQIDETAIRPVLMELGITPHYADPYNARAKIVEPWHHHWVHMKFDRSFPGYCGSNAQDRPEQLGGYNGKGGLIKAGALMPWSEIVAVYAEFIKAYHMETHSELGMCPALCRQQTLLARKSADPRTLALFFQDVKKVMVGRNGVELNGYCYGLGNPDIVSRQGEYIKARWDRMKMGVLYLYEPGGRYICQAENNGLLAANATHDDFVAVKKLHIRHNKMAEEMATNMPILTSVNPVEQMALRRKHAEMTNGPLPAAEPVNIKPLEFSEGWSGQEATLKFRPASPAPDGSKVVRTQVNQGMDSPGETDVAGKVLPANILDAFSAG